MCCEVKSFCLRISRLAFLFVIAVLYLCPGAPAAYSQSSFEAEIDNARIIQMTQRGLGDEVIIARIKAGATKFILSDNDLAELKQAKVSDKVVAAMIESTRLSSARVLIDGNPVQMHTIGQVKTGGRLGRAVSFGIKSVKDKAYLQGQHASVIASRAPVIEIELPANDTIDNYVLVRLDGKGDRRELEMASAGGAVGRKFGVRSDRVIRIAPRPVSGRHYRISPVERLDRGEYLLYVIGSADFEQGIYGRGFDFTVE